MLVWDDLVQLQVLRRVGELVNRRFGVGIGFTDGEGQVVETPMTNRFATVRPTCAHLRADPNGLRACLGFGVDAVALLRDTPELGTKARMLRCHAGLQLVAVPIQLDGQTIGSLFAGGFVQAGHEERTQGDLARRMGQLRIRGNPAGLTMEMPRLSEESIGLLRDLVEMLGGEVTRFLADTKERPVDSAPRSAYSEIIGSSAPMKALFAMLDNVAESDSTTLITGENGTGKELIARAIHYHSPRRLQRFVQQNCSAFNDNLLDSELFGHVKGSFTGAVSDKQGLFKVADGGTFFLDEIGDMSPMLQVKVLRVLQEGTFTPVGGTDQVEVDVRIIAATNRDLRAMVRVGTFREDLYYRVNVINLVVPPLRERVDDLPLLAGHFLDVQCARQRVPPKKLSRGALARFGAYAWPGNIRELENEIERAVVLSGDARTITEEMLTPHIQSVQPAASGDATLPSRVEALEREMLQDALVRTKGNRTRAAQRLGISRRNLIRLIARFGLQGEE